MTGPDRMPGVSIVAHGGAVHLAGLFVLRGRRALDLLAHAMSFASASALRGAGVAHAGDVVLADGRVIAIGGENDVELGPLLRVSLLTSSRVLVRAVHVMASDFRRLQVAIDQARADGARRAA